MNNLHFKFSEKLDHVFLDSIYEDDLEHAEMVFEQYIKQTPLQLMAIDEAYNKGTIETFRQLMHKLKPVFSYVGLTRVMQQAEFIEKRCQSICNISAVEHLYNEFKKEVNAYHPVITDQLAIIKQQIP